MMSGFSFGVSFDFQVREATPQHAAKPKLRLKTPAQVQSNTLAMPRPPEARMQLRRND